MLIFESALRDAGRPEGHHQGQALEQDERAVGPGLFGATDVKTKTTMISPSTSP